MERFGRTVHSCIRKKDDRIVTKVLVVGGNGFIGAPLVDRLVASGFEVSVFDRFSSGKPRYSAQDVRQFKGHFGNRGSMQESLIGQDYVVHLVSMSTPASSTLDATWDLRENVVPTIDFMELASGAGVKRVYFASTGGAIYGDQPNHLLSETSERLPRSPYAIGKSTIEDYLRYFREMGALDSTVLRISNPFGPGQTGQGGHGLIPIAIRNALAGVPTVQFGAGEMIRDFIYIDDLVEMVVRIIGAGETRYDTYNLGSGIGTSVADVLNIIEEIVGPIARDVRPIPASFVRSVVLDVRRYEVEFGKVPNRTISSGIAETVEQIRRGRQDG